MKFTLLLALSLFMFTSLQGCQSSSDTDDKNEIKEVVNTNQPDANEPSSPEPDTPQPEDDTTISDGFTIHENKRVVSLNLGEDYNAWVANDYFRNDFTKVKPVMARVYEKFHDNFDFIFFVLNEDNTPDTISYSGLNISGINNIEGIGKRISSQTSPTFGSSNKLQSTMQLTSRKAMRNGPTLHELMHNWGNSIIDSYYVKSNGEESRSFGHWGFSSVGGQLGGFDLSSLQENVDGITNKYHAHYGNRSNFGYNANGGNGLPYSKLELYLMGFLSSNDVPDTIVFKGLSQNTDERRSGIFHATTKEIITISDIIDEHGERKPSYLNSQTEFKLLTIVLTSSELTESEWNRVDDDVKWFSDIIEPNENTQLYNFYQATEGKGYIISEIHDDDIR